MFPQGCALVFIFQASSHSGPQQLVTLPPHFPTGCWLLERFLLPGSYDSLHLPLSPFCRVAVDVMFYQFPDETKITFLFSVCSTFFFV